ncbi:MAG: 50S ribosomal protein L7/L12 [Pseudomonadota bacterium]
MSNITKEDVIEFIANMSVLELSELVKELEDKFGVSAAAPVAMVAAAGPAAAESQAEEQTEFSVILTSHGDKKIQIIKEVRAITGLGLKEAKTLVDEIPKAVKEAISKEEADKIKAQLEEAGAQVEIK